MKRLALFLLLTAFLLAVVWPAHGYIPSGIGKGPGGSQKGMYRHHLAKTVQDVLNNLTSVAHPGGLPNRTFAYNGLGWLTSEYHPETGALQYDYFDSGKVQTITKESGKEITFEYDSLYRPTSQIARETETGPIEIEIDFYYDGAAIPGHVYTYANAYNHRTGALVKKGDPGVEESCLAWPWFDSQGRNLRKESILASPALTNVMEFGYDLMGNLSSIEYPDGRLSANYSYAAATNLLTGVSVIGSAGIVSLATTLSHNPAGGLQTAAFGNGVLTSITPDVRNRPDIWQTTIGADALVNNDFTYDPFGNITDIGAEEFVYDPLNRLTNATVNGSSFVHGYDAVGNMTSLTNPSGSLSFNYNAYNQIVGASYDADGNLTGDGDYSYVYDQLGQMASCGSDSYAYDALGKRIKTTNVTDSLVYCYLGEQLLATYSTFSLAYFDEVYLEGQLLARVTDNGVGTTTINYAHLNHLGSPIAFTDAAGIVVWPGQDPGYTSPYEIQYYEPFGTKFADPYTPGLLDQNVGFTGKLFDESTGKHYFNARYYNGITTDISYEMPPRFLSPDIIKGNPDEPQSWNRYTYCRNNPSLFFDPSGLDPINFNIGPIPLAFDWEYILYYPSAILLYEDISTTVRHGTQGVGEGPMAYAPTVLAGGQLAALGWVGYQSVAIAEGVVATGEVGNIVGETIQEEGLQGPRYPRDPNDWIVPESWKETSAGEETGGRHRQWVDETGRIRRWWDREGREAGRQRGPHWHDYDDPSGSKKHIDPDDY